MKKVIVSMVMMALCCSAAFAQNELPLDPSVRRGRLDNGMTYYIRHNANPPQRAEFYLNTAVGAVQETPDQDGLAHFLEHMCFNGTKNFPGKNLLNYLQGIGASFGGNINASTGTERTQYMLNNIPLIDPGVVDVCLLIMHDYSHFVTLDPKEIDAERGVILEEKRSRNTADWRMYMEAKKYLFAGSPLSDCSIIGSEHNLKTFKPSSLEAFYHSWYRPDMQSLVVVGDIDVDEVEAKIRKIFADIPPASPGAPKKQKLTFSLGDKPQAAVIRDRECTSNTVEIYWRKPASDSKNANTVQRFSGNLLQSLISIIMNDRLADIAYVPNAPFIEAEFGIERLCNDLSAVQVSANFKDGAASGALEALLAEVERMSRYGFTQGEMQRAETELISRYENARNRASTRKNSDFIGPISRNFFYNSYMLDPAAADSLVKKILPTFTLEMLNGKTGELLSGRQPLILLYTPENESSAVLDTTAFLAIAEKVKTARIAPPSSENVPPAFLDSTGLKPAIASEVGEFFFDSYRTAFSNGVTVILRPSNLEKNRITFDIYKKGGRSVVKDKELYSVAPSLWNNWLHVAGLSRFNSATVSKMLAGRQLSVTPYIDSYVHGIKGSSTKSDFAVAMQMVHLFFTDPRLNASEFRTTVEKTGAMLSNYEKQPDYKFMQALNETLYGGSPRRFVQSSENLSKAKFSTFKKVYRRLFGDCGGAVMVIGGDFDPAEVLPLVNLYIGSIKGGAPGGWKYCGDGIADGNILNDFTIQMQEPKVSVMQVYSLRKSPFSVEAELSYRALAYILDMIYTETLRESEGGTYGASVKSFLGSEPDEYRMLQIYFESNVGQADHLREMAGDAVRKLAAEGPRKDHFDKAVKYFHKILPESQLRLAYWNSAIENYEKYSYDRVSDYEYSLESLTPDKIKAAAAELLQDGCLKEIVMRPE